MFLSVLYKVADDIREREANQPLSFFSKVRLRFYSCKCGIVRIIKKTKRGKNVSQYRRHRDGSETSRKKL